jgi:hypothetical protein
MALGFPTAQTLTFWSSPPRQWSGFSMSASQTWHNWHSKHAQQTPVEIVKEKWYIVAEHKAIKLGFMFISEFAYLEYIFLLGTQKAKTQS